ncbi:MAG TPA: tetratricopeptide repeat protein [Gemmatimonadales bacterium]|nr:tetratricopeptide repeat protein [Gemmatimonadales bacterium]
MRRTALLALLLALPAVVWAQRPAAPAVQNAALNKALQAYNNLEYTQAIAQAQQALKEHLSSAESARAYELLGFAYSATNAQDQAVDAFKQAIQLDPDRALDPARVSPKIYSLFFAALGQVLVVRQLKVDSASFVGGTGAGVPISFTVTSPARVRVRAVSGNSSVLVDSSIVTGGVNLKWPALLPNGNPISAGTWTIVVEAAAGQNTFSASQPVRVALGSVDTVPHLTQLPGYNELPETEVPPKSARPLGMAAMYTGLAGVGVLGLNNSNLGSAPSREILTVGAAALIVGTIFTMKKPAPRPVPANIQFNQLLREQITRRNADIAQQNAKLRQQVNITVAPLPKGAR